LSHQENQPAQPSPAQRSPAIVGIVDLTLVIVVVDCCYCCVEAMIWYIRCCVVYRTFTFPVALRSAVTFTFTTRYVAVAVTLRCCYTLLFTLLRCCCCCLRCYVHTHLLLFTFAPHVEYGTAACARATHLLHSHALSASATPHHTRHLLSPLTPSSPPLACNLTCSITSASSRKHRA